MIELHNSAKWTSIFRNIPSIFPTTARRQSLDFCHRTSSISLLRVFYSHWSFLDNFRMLPHKQLNIRKLQILTSVKERQLFTYGSSCIQFAIHAWSSTSADSWLARHFDFYSISNLLLKKDREWERKTVCISTLQMYNTNPQQISYWRY